MNIKHEKVNNKTHRNKNRFNRLLMILAVAAAVLAGDARLHAQTCSCAGAPMFNPLEYQSMQKDKRWHFELSFKHHAINDLVEGSEQVDDYTDRSRSAQSVFLEVRYALTKRLSVIGLLNFTGHRRDVGISSSAAASPIRAGTGFTLSRVLHSKWPTPWE